MNPNFQMRKILYKLNKKSPIQKNKNNNNKNKNKERKTNNNIKKLIMIN